MDFDFILQTILNEPIYLSITLIFLLIIIYSVLKKFFKLLVIALVLLILYVGYLGYTDSELPKQSEEIFEKTENILDNISDFIQTFILYFSANEMKNKKAEENKDDL